MAETDLSLIDKTIESLSGLRESVSRRRQLSGPQRAAMNLLCGPTDAPGFRIFPSMAAAAAALNVPKSLLKKLKNDGCPAFVGSRVKEDQILPWMQAQEAMGESDLGDDKESLERRFLMVRIERQQLAYRKESDALIERGEVESFLLGAIERIKAILREKLKNELPPKLEGLRAPEISARMDEVIPRICSTLKYMFNE